MQYVKTANKLLYITFYVLACSIDIRFHLILAKEISEYYRPKRMLESIDTFAEEYLVSYARNVANSEPSCFRGNVSLQIKDRLWI